MPLNPNSFSLKILFFPSLCVAIFASCPAAISAFACMTPHLASCSTHVQGLPCFPFKNQPKSLRNRGSHATYARIHMLHQINCMNLRDSMRYLHCNGRTPIAFKFFVWAPLQRLNATKNSSKTRVHLLFFPPFFLFLFFFYSLDPNHASLYLCISCMEQA